MGKRISTDMLDKAMDRYLEVGNAVVVGEELGISTSAIYRHLEKRQIKRGATLTRDGKTHHNAKLTLVQEKHLSRRYATGEDITKLESEFGVTRGTIRAVVKKHGGAIRPPGEAPLVYTDELLAKIADMWDAGMTQTKIAAKLGYAQGSITKVLYSGRVELKRTMRESRIPFIGGGVVFNGDGYHLTHKSLAPKEYWVMANASSYILTHRLAMAKAIGRPLHKHETVHHIDGDKANNATANLQLRQGKHGKGVVMCCAKCGSSDITMRAL